ncbi:BrnA antitoxin family protein [Rhodoblastus sp.]|uniref:BrnA antitoxin family protein n=1 Tax=Rhodoblastus sp. TaxID=1962975 RepID=UPI003F946387
MPAKMRDFQPGHDFTKTDWDEVSDNPEATDAELSQARPFKQVFPELAESIKRTRGKQKAPTKELVSLRLDHATLAAFRATGPGWQARIDTALRDALAAQKPRTPRQKLKKPA